ncbi:hypothetical protein UFOVP736_62 [uncultured Caudovirales phage]|uniref:Uncharacterized protein n=1 Tax=uncultured Caudovirales phage TaxID=2100421 RepID=A0A6J5NNX3_9CAUD|nr:hypothetical protein UFOVP705_19 [uncultured Caudovirales phage]CAB5224365.1 hypothetical protein UFOVP736_62 [uncultured Caudovirales phage]
MPTAPETLALLNRELAGEQITIGDWTTFARRLERERNEARRMWSIHQDKLAELREQVRLTIMENLHLADGDVCTLKRLKDSINFDLDSQENDQVQVTQWGQVTPAEA